MDHVVYVSRSLKELDKLIAGGRSMLVRGSTGKKVPYGKVNAGDRLFFATGNSTRNVVKAAASAGEVYDSPKLSGIEPECLLAGHASELQLSDVEMAKWSVKKYLTLIALQDFSPIVPFSIAARGDGETDDWIVLDNIDEIIE
ncbi:MAG: hypothetical protein A4E28_01342 [Methanocella sp. PtaU1.Bin125]|nr:MAG: hypothetical protein A4E28_01342 [Methanocella sp. PtaU1.Bin125]